MRRTPFVSAHPPPVPRPSSARPLLVPCPLVRTQCVIAHVRARSTNIVNSSLLCPGGRVMPIKQATGLFFLMSLHVSSVCVCVCAVLRWVCQPPLVKPVYSKPGLRKRRREHDEGLAELFSHRVVGADKARRYELARCTCLIDLDLVFSNFQSLKTNFRDSLYHFSFLESVPCFYWKPHSLPPRYRDLVCFKSKIVC